MKIFQSLGFFFIVCTLTQVDIGEKDLYMYNKIIRLYARAFKFMDIFTHFFLIENVAAQNKPLGTPAFL